ncbi:PREDICTED: AT-rich interactive domain-containing protein 5A-like [Cyprinodon variegatus]|uniref:AT-rich interactive domain 5A n=2 Tax=Cyprinodon variegatus TaxID=28743 RepID=A0A3Q2EGN8_CYPVA|nr:PREDICTED: AT-rich interactive domain-containing protein 5A-like [Cyprinodon variegatus]
MAEEDQSEASQQTAGSDEDKAREKQASPCVIEIHDSTTECEEETRPSKVPMEEKAFIASLHSFMKDKGTPIERIPHLGFKQIDLWMIYKAVEKLGGYESVTTGRLWKRVYDELGGSPGSTSAATCTRRHYERLVLPFERHIKGEDDKPLPPSKPRKPYKRNQEGKMNKADGKRKRSSSEREMDSELLPQRSPDVVCQSESMMNPHFALWPPSADRHPPECSQPGRTPGDFCTPVNGHILQVPASSSWVAHLPSATGEVISPLEKKKRMAQASLNVPTSSQREDKERPSVIHCSQSPVRASSSRNCNSSEGSPLPLSSSSSRSPSPLSVSSEESPAGTRDKPRPSSTSTENCSSTAKTQVDSKPVSCSQTATNASAQKKDAPHISSQTLHTDSVKSQIKDSAWKPYHKGTSKCYTYPIHSPPSISTSTSGFTRVTPKSVQLLRPAPIRPTYKHPHSRLLQIDNSLTCTKKLGSLNQWPYHIEKRDRSRTVQQKVPPTQQGLPQSALPASCVLSTYDKSGRESRHQQPVHPAFLPHRMRLPHSQLMYHPMPVGPSHSALIASAVYPYPYSIPLLNPQVGYPLPTMNQMYPHKL